MNLIKYKDIQNNLYYEFELHIDFVKIRSYAETGNYGTGCTITYQELLKKGHWFLTQPAFDYLEKIYKNKAFI